MYSLKFPKLRIIPLIQLLYMATNINIRILRTIPNISNQLKVLDDAIDRFIKSLLMNYECNSFERELLSLPAKMGGLGIILP